MANLSGKALVGLSVTFTLLNSSGVTIGGCSTNVKKACSHLKFKENDTVYLRAKAEKGLLRKITVKRIIINKGKFGRQFNSFSPLYVDSLNSIYNERELVTKEEAIDLAEIFYIDQVSEAQTAINSLGCK